jgi:hypothetical protein
MSESVTVACGHVMNMTPTGITTAVPTAGPWTRCGSPTATIQAYINGTGAVTATVVVEVSNGPDDVNNPAIVPVANKTLIATLALTGTTSDSIGTTLGNQSWRWVRIRVTAISGTGATVTALLGN